MRVADAIQFSIYYLSPSDSDEIASGVYLSNLYGLSGRY